MSVADLVNEVAVEGQDAGDEAENEPVPVLGIGDVASVYEAADIVAFVQVVNDAGQGGFVGAAGPEDVADHGVVGVSEIVAES